MIGTRTRGSLRRLAYSLAERLPNNKVTRTIILGTIRLCLLLRIRPRYVLESSANEMGIRVPVRARLSGTYPMVVPWNDLIGRSIYQEGSWEPVEMEILRILLKPGMVFLDIGANVGTFSVVASDLVGPEGQVHAFEPDPTTFAWLQRNLALNYASNTFAHQFAVSDRSGEATLSCAGPANTGLSSLRIRHNDPSGQKVAITCTTLDEFVHSSSMKRLDFIKIDVEGAEMKVVAGASSLFERGIKPVLLIEFNPNMLRQFDTSCAQLAKRLTDSGFALFEVHQLPLKPVDERRLLGPIDRYFNVLAWPKHRPCNPALTS